MKTIKITPKMLDYSWIDQNKDIGRLITILPGFSDYLKGHTKDDFEVLLDAYTSHLIEVDKYSLGIAANINLLRRKYKEHIMDKMHKTDEHSCEGHDVPAWEMTMDIHEREHLNSLIRHIPSLSTFLRQNPTNQNLTEVILQYEEEHERELKKDRPLRFAIDSVKKYFQNVMENHKEALHFVSTEYRINDSDLIKAFFIDARDNFFNKNLAKDDCIPFLKRYVHSIHPYIDAEIGARYAKYGIYNIAFVFYSHVFHHIFSSQNIYWNNSEGLFGCASTVAFIVKLLYDNSTIEEKSINSEVTHSLVELCYLLASRVAYWDDRGCMNTFSYRDDVMPIRMQDKIRFYNTRVTMLDLFPEVFKSYGYSDTDILCMKLADLKDLHVFAYNEGLVGDKSIYLKRISDFEKQIEPIQSVQKASLIGKEKSEEFAWNLYKNYIQGKYCMKWEMIRSVLPSNININKAKDDAYSSEDIPLVLQNVREDQELRTFKKDREAIRQYLKGHGIKWFYHFTERNKLSSIIKQGGLLSYQRCLDLGVVMPTTKDMSKSRDKDASFNLEDYVRVSYCRYLPKIDERKLEGDKDFVLLRISTEVAELESTLFTDMEATREEHKRGDKLEDLMRVNIAATQKEFCSDRDPEYWQYQSEVMIKGKIPIRYILNINNPENL